MARKARLSHAAGYKLKATSLRLEVRRDVSRTGAPRFVACAFFRSPKGYGKSGYTCLAGRNPRMAVAAVLRREASLVAGRRGAFEGWR